MYTLSGASATFSSPNPNATITLTGDFTFDPSGPTLDNVAITATETSGSGVLTATSVLFNKPGFSGFADIQASASAATDIISISFIGNLGPAAAMISNVEFFPTFGTSFSTNSVKGSAVPAPEPNTIALLGGAIGLLLLARRAHRSDRAA
jgi:hypothetical protein